MVMWGFMTQYLLPQASFVAQAAGVLLSGLLLWEVVVRGNLSLSIAFLEEMWSRNLGHLFVSPIRSWEMATGIIIAALLRTLLGLVPVSLMAWAFFGYSIYSLGLPLVAFFAILQMFSWSIGLCHVGHDHARRPERRKLRLGCRLHPDAGERRLLSGVGAAALAAGHLAGPAAGLRLRRHARHPGREDRPLGHAGHRLRPVGGLPRSVGFQIFQWFFRLSRRAGTLLGQGE